MTEIGNEITGKEISEEDLFDFKLDDLSLDDLDSGDSEAEDSEEDILELVDLIEEGEKDKYSEALDEEIAKLLEEEGDAEMLEKEDSEVQAEGVSAREETLDAGDVLSTAEVRIDFSDSSLTDKEEGAEASPEEKEIDEGTKAPEEPAESGELDLDLSAAFEPETEIEKTEAGEEGIFEPFEGESQEEEVLDLETLLEHEEPAPEEETARPEEEVSDMVSAEPELPKIEEGPVEPVVGISEEKIESTVTRAVEDAVGRVTRDTVINAAGEVFSEEKIEGVVTKAVEGAVERVTRETVTNVVGEIFSEEKIESIVTRVVEGTVERVTRETVTNVVGEIFSEEKIEGIVTGVVEGVVERVTREAVANVAEKVFTEAIEALKQSLEPSSD
jgi:hypothetical protein